MRRRDENGRSVLIVDNDRAFAESLAATLQTQGYHPLHVETLERAVAVLRDPPTGYAPAPVVLIEARLGGFVCGGPVPRLQMEQPDLVCVLMTRTLDAATALAALRCGAYDCIDKACDPNLLMALLERCFGKVELQREREAAYEALRHEKERAEAASRGKSGFLATMSHELRTPLNAIIGFSEMMLREVLGPLGNEQYRTYVSDIHESGAHLLQIINDILDLSKAEAGKLDLHEDLFDLRRTVAAARQLMSGRLRAAGLSDAIELATDLPLLRADERKTKQVLLNLLTNAVKFTPPGGHVELSARFDGEAGIMLSVADTGIGIAAEDLTRVLQPFEQVDSSFSRAHQGTGLGLPLVKAIMELHGGKVELHSEVGRGTRVSIIFPRQRAAVETAPGNSRDAA